MRVRNSDVASLVVQALGGLGSSEIAIRSPSGPLSNEGWTEWEDLLLILRSLACIPLGTRPELLPCGLLHRRLDCLTAGQQLS